MESEGGRCEECETDGMVVTDPKKETFREAVASVAFLQTLAMTSVMCAYAVGKIVLP